MKKVLMMLCAVALLGMTACKKDNPNENITPGGGTEQPTIPTGEGVFNPAQKIVSITVDGMESEQWNWVDHVLTTIMTNDGSGDFEVSSSFTYNNYRVVTMNTVMQGVPVTATYTYVGDKLSTMTMNSGIMEIMSMDFTHNAAGKVSHITVNVDSTMLGLLSQFIGGGIPNIFGKATSKVGFSNISINANLDWQGENVAQTVFDVLLNGDVTLGEARTMINLDSLAGSFASMLSLLPDSTLIPLSIRLKDTTSYAYDDHPNPFCGFLGALDLANFSANNVTTSVNSGTATLTATLDLSFIQLPLTLPYSLGSTTETFTYTYNNAGFPNSVTNSGGNVTQYRYLE